MKEEEIQEYNEGLRTYATLALPGVIIALGVLPNPSTVAGTCFEIAEAMINEYKKREHVSKD